MRPKVLQALLEGADLSHMDKEIVVLRQQLRERAQRLYAIGEWHMAARILLELAADESVTEVS
jgi:hypothetical protein